MCVAMASCAAFATDDGAERASAQTTEAIDARIKEVREEIAIYQRRALFADRRAQRLLPHDFLGHRQALVRRERYRQTVDSLQKELAALEQQRATLGDKESPL